MAKLQYWTLNQISLLHTHWLVQELLAVEGGTAISIYQPTEVYRRNCPDKLAWCNTWIGWAKQKKGFLWEQVFRSYVTCGLSNKSFYSTQRFWEYLLSHHEWRGIQSKYSEERIKQKFKIRKILLEKKGKCF